MSFKKPQINKITTDMKGLTIYLRAVKKFGKSTLFRDAVLEKFHDPTKGMLVGLGAEMGYGLLDNLNCTHCDTWDELVDLKNWLIEAKGKEHNIEMVAFDVVDEFFPIVEKEVVRLNNIENPKKQVTSVKAAFGGYNAGPEKVQEIAKDYFLDLKKAGIGVWAIAHTKFKNVKQKGDIDDGYQSLSSTLNSNYESVFGDVFDCVLTGYIDRAIEDETVTVGDKDKTIHHATDEIRKLYFRGTTFIDAGCRFADGAVPEFMVFDKPNMAKDFIDVLEEGMRLSRSDKVSTEEFKKIQKEDAKEKESIEAEYREQHGTTESESETVSEDLEEAKTIFNDIRTKYKNATPQQKQNVKNVLIKHGKKKLEVTLPIDILNEIVSQLA